MISIMEKEKFINRISNTDIFTTVIGAEAVANSQIAHAAIVNGFTVVLYGL